MPAEPIRGRRSHGNAGWLRRSARCARRGARARRVPPVSAAWRGSPRGNFELFPKAHAARRSEEHTSELQSLRHLVCRLLLEKKNTSSPRASRTYSPRAATRSRRDASCTPAAQLRLTPRGLGRTASHPQRLSLLCIVLTASLY